MSTYEFQSGHSIGRSNTHMPPAKSYLPNPNVRVAVTGNPVPATRGAA